MLRKIGGPAIGVRNVAVLSPPALVITITIIVAVIAVGVLLRITAPWPDSFLDRPNGSPGIRGDIIGVRGLPGGPAPMYIDAERETSKRVISPGESTTINFTLRNIWDTRIEITVPMEATLKEVNSSSGEAIPVALTGMGHFSGSLEPGEELTGAAIITSGMSADLDPGKYTLRVDVKIRPPEKSESTLGFFSGFVVIPPEGALNTTVIVRQLKEAHGTSITLEKVHFTSEKTTIEALAVPPPGELAGPYPYPAPERIATIQPQGSEYRAASSVPMKKGVANLTARYKIDGGPWRQLRGHGYRKTAEGIHHEWKTDPVSANANTLVLAIMSETNPGDADKVLWEWTVDLREGN